MKKLTNYLLIICILSFPTYALFGCSPHDKKESIFHNHPISNKIYPSVNFVVESPFTDKYGIYSLADSGHSISNYISSFSLGFNKDTSTITVKAPYLTYTTEANQYYYGTVTDTAGGSSTLGPYDTWSLVYNNQPYITSTSNILVRGYHGSTFKSNLSYTLTGNSSSTSSKYYLQNLKIKPTIPSNITAIEVRFVKVYYASSYHEVTTSEDKYKTITYPDETVSQVVNKTVYTSNTFINETVQFTASSGYSFTNFWGEIGSGIKSLEIISSNLSTGSVTFQVVFQGGGWGNQKNYAFTAYASSSKPSSTVYDKTVTTTTIDTYNISSPTLNINKDKLYWYPSYFLSQLTCSGRGDNADKEMVINAWADLKSVYQSLPSNYKTAFSNGTLSDVRLGEALKRYDYVVFYKNYGLEYFASRSNKSNRHYAKSEYRPFIKESDNTVIIVIIASSISILSITVLSILLIKKRIINKG